MATNPNVWIGDNTVIPIPPAPAPTWPPPPPGPTPAPAPTPAPPPAPPITIFTLFSSLAVDIGTGQLLYDSGNDKILAGTKAYRSSDLAQSFYAPSSGWNGLTAVGVNTSGRSIGVINVATVGYYAFYSTDSGLSALGSLIPNPSAGTWDHVDSAGGSNWVIWSSGSTDILYSTDNGVTWTVGSRPAVAPGVLVCAAFNPLTATLMLFADATGGATAAVKTTDGGQTWTAVVLPISRNWTSAACNSLGTWMILCADRNIVSYNDGGAWVTSNSPILTSKWAGPAQYLLSNTTWYISTGPNDVTVVGTDGVYISTNDGVTFTKLVATIPNTAPSGNFLAQVLTSVGYLIIEVAKTTTGKRFLVSPIPSTGPSPAPSPTPAPMSALTETFVATAGQTVFDLTTYTYTPGSHQLMVYVNGVFQNPNNYTETSSSRVTLGFATLALNDTVDIAKVA